MVGVSSEIGEAVAASIGIVGGASIVATTVATGQPAVMGVLYAALTVLFILAVVLAVTVTDADRGRSR